jgi:hypothetical protein
MSARTDYLLKHGWRLDSSRKKGMFRIHKWWKVGHGTGTMSQEAAYNLERSNQAYLKLEDAKKDVVEAEAAMRTEYAAAIPVTGIPRPLVEHPRHGWR